LERSDVLATPHIAGVTDVSYRGISQHVAENIGHLMAHEPIENCVNWTAMSHNQSA
jgi:phosphoglycerate dehydrogenase-like enzyme